MSPDFTPDTGGPRSPAVAVLVPCHNEAPTVAAVVAGFRAALPEATVYVYDNGSTDATWERALETGAIVRGEPLAGKGNVVRRMFTDVEADVYVLVDGDDTYDAGAAPAMVELLCREHLAMVVGRRVHRESDAYRRGHVAGNLLFTTAVERIFGKTFQDVLSGYRIFSRRFVKSFPVFAPGFEIETELTIHALTLKLPVLEVDTEYRARPQGSSSKLSTWRDGFRILGMILRMFRNERPLLFYSLLGVALLVTSVVLAYPLLITYLATGLVPRFPTAILATGLSLAGIVSLACGLILDAVTHGRREARLLAYLATPPLRQG
jgi:glycosyltransferase involved in cell wall biosynthesis